MQEYSNEESRLQKLSGSDFEMAEGQPDIRNWPVKDWSGNRLGEVTELIFDRQSRKVRYLTIDLKESSEAAEKQVLVPIGMAEIHEKEDEVILPEVTAGQLSSLPAYDEDRFEPAHEAELISLLSAAPGMPVMSGTPDSVDFYDQAYFNEENLYRNRPNANHTGSL